MYKKTITFKRYDDVEITEDFYFNINKSELIKWLTTSGDYTLDKVLQKLSKEKNGKQVMTIFEDMIHLSYGRPSLDNRKFEKTEEIWMDFYQTEAYSNLFTELVTDASKAAVFVNKIIPKELAEEVEKIIRDNPEGIPDDLKDYVLPDDSANVAAAQPTIRPVN